MDGKSVSVLSLSLHIWPQLSCLTEIEYGHIEKKEIKSHRTQICLLEIDKGEVDSTFEIITNNFVWARMSIIGSSSWRTP
jgi:hypothetical protein